MIRIEGLGRRFGSREVLHDLTLRVRPGEIVALVGPNGAGKSTTLRALAGIIRPTTGKASIAGQDVTSGGSPARRGLGYLPQKLGMPQDTVVSDLLTLVAAVREVPIVEARRAISLQLGHRLDAKLAELSGGERQRVMLALATMGTISALLLDEPSISLDSDGADEVREAIRAAARAKAAVLFASHHLSDVAALADRIAVMVDGRIVAEGTLRELTLQAGLDWETSSAGLSPIERVYQTLVTRARRGEPDSAPGHERIERGAA
jgi:ABC-type multidrug transport system ATPase subunit